MCKYEENALYCKAIGNDNQNRLKIWFAVMLNEFTKLNQ